MNLPTVHATIAPMHSTIATFVAAAAAAEAATRAWSASPELRLRFAGGFADYLASVIAAARSGTAVDGILIEASPQPADHGGVEAAR